MQIISKFATLSIPRKCNGGEGWAIVAAEGRKTLVVNEMLNYKFP